MFVMKKLDTSERPFIGDDFLLQSEAAVRLYHDYARDMPIIDYHNHLSAKKIAEDKPLKNITDAWLNGDHYKWRAMRANGVDEKYITGAATLEDRFMKWADTVPHTMRNPLFHWTHLELKRYFGIDQLLDPSNGKEIYGNANLVLAEKTPAALLKEMKVEVVCTTDDPTDDLRYHQEIAEKKLFTKVYPTFRSDALFFIGTLEFKGYLKKLSDCSGLSIGSYTDLLGAIDQRLEHFHENGCRLSDFGVGGPLSIVDFTEEEVALIFDKNLRNEALSSLEIHKYRTSIMLYLGKKYHDKKWVQQYHLGPIRNNNSRLKSMVGADVGCDSIGDEPMAAEMSSFFDQLESGKQLAKTICYNLNPSQNEVFATMMGNFGEAGVPGKMQWGSAWWFLDQKDGMEKQLNVLSNMGLLSRFVGMLTDSRSFLSFPRHEYFRRILCNLLAEDMNKGLMPNNMEVLGKMVQDICYNNAKAYFEFE